MSGAVNAQVLVARKGVANTCTRIEMRPGYIILDSTTVSRMTYSDTTSANNLLPCEKAGRIIFIKRKTYLFTGVGWTEL